MNVQKQEEKREKGRLQPFFILFSPLVCCGQPQTAQSRDALLWKSLNAVIQSWHIIERAKASVACGISQLFLDDKQAIVLGNALATSWCARFDLSGIGRHHQISDSRVFCLA